MTDRPAENLSPDHLRALAQITGVMNKSLHFDEALNNIIEAVMTVTKAQRGFLMVAENDNTDDLRVLVARGLDGKTIEEEGYSTTIVKQVVTTREPLLTNNAQFDTRYQVGQSIIMRGLRAILCAPLTVQERLIGAIYVDTSMRSGNFSQADRELLSAVAGQAAIALENARLYSVAVEKGRLEQELKMASEIQAALMPRAMPNLPGYDIAPRWKAAREVAGDFYDVFPLGEQGFGLVIADVSDKGAPAALFMAVARTMIRAHAHAGLTAVETVARTNDLILEDADSGMFVTVYHSMFEVGGRSVHVNAGHNPPLLYRAATNETFFMPRGGRALGWFPGNPLQEVQLELHPGDIIVYYTDGVTDAENPQGEFFGEERLNEVVKSCRGLSANQVLDRITNAVEVFCDGAPPFDDLTIVVVVYTG